MKNNEQAEELIDKDKESESKHLNTEENKWKSVFENDPELLSVEPND